MARRRGKFLKSLEEYCSILRGDEYDREVIGSRFKAIVLIRRASDDIDYGAIDITDNYYTVTVTPELPSLSLNDKVVRHKLIKKVLEEPTEMEILDGNGVAAVLTVVHFESNRNIQRILCRDLTRPTG